MIERLQGRERSFIDPLLSMVPIKLNGLRPQTYEHPRDKSALDALRKAAGLGVVVSKLSAWGFERTLRVQLTGGYLARHIGQLSGTAQDTPGGMWASGRAGSAGSFHRAWHLNALTTGIERPLIVINAGAVDSLTEEEILFVVGHEVGYIKSGMCFIIRSQSSFPHWRDFILWRPAKY